MKSQSPAAVARPLGGYVLISVNDLCCAWTAYRTRRISLIDLRAWFACHEMVARRCTLDKKREANYSFEELHKLVGGVGGEHVRKAVRRLQTAGLLTWSASRLLLSAGESLAATSRPMVNSITNNRRRVPVPRRTLRFLSLGTTKATIATILGHLLRCVYFRSGACTAAGTCKASWIATIFGVDTRNVKAARKHLVAVGWLCISSVPQWRLNRFGASVLVNLAWARNEFCTSKTSRLPAQKATSTPPPDSNKELLPEYRNQKPASGRNSGSEKQGKPERPTLKKIMPGDLSDTSRILTLFEEAVRTGTAKPGEASRLQFIAAAEHARHVGNKNPCGLFAAIIRRGLWAFITQRDEDCATNRLKRLREARVQVTLKRQLIGESSASNHRPESAGNVLRSLQGANGWRIV